MILESETGKMILELSLATIGGGTVIVGLWNFLFKGVINKRRFRK